jgi:hypothetical protein
VVMEMKGRSLVVDIWLEAIALLLLQMKGRSLF